MAVLTVTSTAAGDGNVYIDNGGTWATVRGAASGTAQPTADPVNVYSSTFTSHSIGRIFLPFNTSSLTAAATITAATLTFTVSTVHGSAADLHVVKSTQASPTDLVNDDYNNLEFTSGGSVNVATTGEKVITLDATGLTWLSKTGTSQLAIITSYDQSNTDPGANDYRFSVNMTENATPGNRPTLAITYTVPTLGGDFKFL